jgi:DNA/RNA-binding domain of Phe-tRNA-synthetase-like protein
MEKTLFRIDEEILSAFQGVNIGVLLGGDVDLGAGDESLEAFKAAVVEDAVESFGSEPVTFHPNVRSWREMYRAFKTKPGDYRPSAEALLRRAIKRRGLPRINAAVDTYNAVSMRHLIPMGGFDLDRIQGTIVLRFSEGGEPFIPLGASKPEETYPGEVVYADDTRVLTRRWNYRDCDETKITEDTRALILFVDGTVDIPRESVESALRDLESSLKRFCGGTYTAKITDSEEPGFSTPGQA